MATPNFDLESLGDPCDALATASGLGRMMRKFVHRFIIDSYRGFVWFCLHSLSGYIRLLFENVEIKMWNELRRYVDVAR